MSFNLMLAQSAIEGIVKDAESGLPLEYATVALYKNDSTLVSGVITSEEGVFSFKGVKDGNYYISVYLIGYLKSNNSITIPSGNLEVILLNKNDVNLKEVTVIAERKPVIQQDNKLVIDVGSYITTAGKTAIDIMKSLPGIISSENSLSILGKDIIVFIDGRPSRLSGNELIQYLNTVHGNQVDKIEIIANPSSEYDAEYNGAIINIKLKRDESLGLNGSFSTLFGIKESGLITMPGINLNYRTKKVNLYGIYNLNNGKYKQTIDYVRKYHDLEIPLQYDEHGIYKPGGTFNNIRLGLDYFVSTKHILGLLLTGGTYSGGNNNHTITNIHNIGSNQIDSIIISPLKMDIDSKNISANINHNWKINEKGTSLNSDFNYSLFDMDQSQSILSDYYTNDVILKRHEGSRHFINQKTDIWSAKVDFVQPIFKNGKIELGFKYDFVNRKNDLLYEILHGQNWMENGDLSNYFKYKEQIIASYINASKKIDKLTINLGLRLEKSIIEGNQVTIDSTFTKNRIGLYPSFRVNYALTEYSDISVSYSKKVARPSFSMLNPFKFYTSPNTYQVGNPDLDVSNFHSVDISYNYKKILFSLSYTKRNNMFIQEPYLDEQTRNLIYTYQNFGKSENYGFNLFTPFNFAKWWRLNFNLGVYYVDLNSAYIGSPYSKNYFNANLNISNSFIINKSTTIGMNARYNTSTWNIASKIEPRGYMDILIAKSILKGKGNISLMVIDPFRWETFTSNLKYMNIDQKNKNIPDLRMIRLSFQYSFGSSKIEKNRRRDTGLENIENRVQ